MTRDEAREILERGGSVYYHAWTWTGRCRNCWDEYNCCADDFETVEDTLDDIECYARSWDDVKSHD